MTPANTYVGVLPLTVIKLYNVDTVLSLKKVRLWEDFCIGHTVNVLSGTLLSISPPPLPRPISWSNKVAGKAAYYVHVTYIWDRSFYTFQYIEEFNAHLKLLKNRWKRRSSTPSDLDLRGSRLTVEWDVPELRTSIEAAQTGYSSAYSQGGRSLGLQQGTRKKGTFHCPKSQARQAVIKTL